VPVCSEEALEASLTALAEHASGSKQRSNWMSTYLVALRMAAAGYNRSTTGADQATDDVFVLVPDHRTGRVSPFVDLGSANRWLKVANSGRSTVWNTGTTGKQTVLFTGDHFSNVLKPDAREIVLDALGSDDPLPHRDALAVLLTRDVDWPAEPTRPELHAAAAAFLGIDVAAFDALTDDVLLGVPVLGEPAWSPQLLERSELGPRDRRPPAVDAAPRATAVAAGATPDVATDELVDEFGRFLTHHGVAPGGTHEITDLLAAALSSQLVIMAGPSGSGKSLTAGALSAFFALKTNRARLESSRLLARPQEFFGYYSPLADKTFMAYDSLLALLRLEDQKGRAPLITIEEANLSPIEGYLSPLVHGLSGLERERLPISLHTLPDTVDSQVPGWGVPPILELGPYARVFATLNIDADSPAPARKVVSRACVTLLETPTFDTALEALGTLEHPSLDEADGPAAGSLGRPTAALGRYLETGNQAYEQAVSNRAALLRDQLGVDVIAHRQLQKALMYMAWYVELAGEGGDGDPELDPVVVEAAADNALLHFVLPSLSANYFEKAVRVLDDGTRTGVLASRLMRLRVVADENRFGPPLDFWGALS